MRPAGHSPHLLPTSCALGLPAFFRLEARGPELAGFHPTSAARIDGKAFSSPENGSLLMSCADEVAALPGPQNVKWLAEGRALVAGIR